MNTKLILQAVGLFVIGAVGIAASANGLKPHTTAILVVGVLVIAAPEALDQLDQWPFGGE